jgi:inward rectifier potassium channel
MAVLKPKRAKLAEFTNSGFSNLTNVVGGRLINGDGSYNVVRTGVSIKDRLSIFHTLLTMPWWNFFIWVLVSFVFINTLFATIYVLIGVHNLRGMSAETPLESFAEAFFFSAQTITTVGYGHISPGSLLAGAIASFESLLGLMGFALATGILYGRFSGPVAKILFSKHMVVAPFQGKTALMFRIANLKSNSLSDVSCQFLLSWMQVEDGGQEVRKYYALPMERDTINSLALSWTIVHPIIEESPLYGYTNDQLNAMEAEFLVVIKGWDETSRQLMTTRTSYISSQIVWGAKFEPMFKRTPGGMHTVLQLNQISDYKEAPLPLQGDLFNTLSSSTEEEATPTKANQ